MITIYVRKIGTQKWLRLTEFGVIQNEGGDFYGITRNGPYQKPKLKDFDTYKPTIPYRKFTGGSHASTKQLDLDFSLDSNYEYCFGNVCTVVAEENRLGWYQRCLVGIQYIEWVHVDNRKPKGKYSAFTPLGRIAKRALDDNGNVIPQHLHIQAYDMKFQNRSIRNILLAQEKAETAPVVPTPPIATPPVDETIALKAKILELEKINSNYEDRLNQIHKLSDLSSNGN